MQINFDAIRASHRIEDVCASRGIELRKAGKSLDAPCLLHQEKRGRAFTVFPDKQRWRCYGKCDKGGDVIDLVAALDGITVAEAAEKLGNGTNWFHPAPARRHKAVTQPPALLPEHQLERMRLAAHRLANSPTLCERIAAARGWKPETVRHLALLGDIGHEPGEVLFYFRTGLKARTRERKGEWKLIERRPKPEKDVYGSAGRECWRQSLLHPGISRVIFAEGEPDAISLIDAGLESDGKTLVVALASASTLPDPEPFRGRECVICGDNDEAGQKSTAKLVALLAPVARSVRVATLTMEAA